MRPTERRPTVTGGGIKGPSSGGTVRQPGSHIPVPVRKSHGKRKKDKGSPDTIQVAPQPLSELLKTIRPPRDNLQPFVEKDNVNRTSETTNFEAPSAKDNSNFKESFLPRKLRSLKKESKDQQRVKHDSCSINFKNDRKVSSEGIIPNGCNKISKKFREAFCEANNIRNSNEDPGNNKALLRDVEDNLLTGEKHQPNGVEVQSRDDEFLKTSLEVSPRVAKTVVDQENNRPNQQDGWKEFHDVTHTESEENPSDTSSSEEKCYLDNFCSAGERDDSDRSNSANLRDVEEGYHNQEIGAILPQFQEFEQQKEMLQEEISRLRAVLEDQRYRLQHKTQLADMAENLRRDLEREKTLRHEAEVRLKEALCDAERCKVELASLQNSVKANDEANILLRTESKFASLKHDIPSYEGKIRRYQNRIAALEKENLMLLNELKSLQPPRVFDPKEHEDAICRILTKRLEVLGKENSNLMGENEQQRAQYEQCLDQVANQVVQTLLVQKKLEGDCKKLRSRLLELEEENRRLTQEINEHVTTGNCHEQVGPNLYSQEEIAHRNSSPSHHSKTCSGNSFNSRPPNELGTNRICLHYPGQEYKIRNDLPGDVSVEAANSNLFVSWKDVSPTSHDSNTDDAQIFLVSPYGSEETQFSPSDSSEKTDTEKENTLTKRRAIPTTKINSSSSAANRRESFRGNRNYAQPPKYSAVKVSQDGLPLIKSVSPCEFRNKNSDAQRHFSKEKSYLEECSRETPRTKIPSRWQKVVIANKDMEFESKRKRTNSKHGARPKSYQIIPAKEDNISALYHASVDNTIPSEITKRPRSCYPCNGVVKETLYKSVVRKDLKTSSALEFDSSSLFSPLPESESSLFVEDGVGRKHKDEGYSTMSSDQQIDGNETRAEGEEHQPSEATGPSTDESVTEFIDGSMSSSSDSGLGPLQCLAEFSLNNSEISEDGDEELFVRKKPDFGGKSRRAVVLSTFESRGTSKIGPILLPLHTPDTNRTLTSNNHIPSNHIVNASPTRLLPSVDISEYERKTQKNGEPSTWHLYEKDILLSRDQNLLTAEKATLTEPEDQWRQKAAVWSLEDSTWTLSASSSTTSCSSSRSSRKKGCSQLKSPVNCNVKFPSTDSSSEEEWIASRHQLGSDGLTPDKGFSLVEQRKPSVQTEPSEYLSSNSFQVAKHLLSRRGHQDSKFGSNLERVSSDSVLYLKDLFRNLESSMEPGLHTVKGRMDLHILPQSPPSAESRPLHLTGTFALSREENNLQGEDRQLTGRKPFAQEAARPDTKEDRSPTTSLSSVYSSSSCQVASDEEEVGFASVKCSRDPDLSSETDSEYDIEHKTFVEQWLQKEVSPEHQADQNGGDKGTWRFSCISEDTRCFSNDELRTRRTERPVSDSLYASYCDLRKECPKAQPSGKVQIVKPFSHTEPTQPLTSSSTSSPLTESPRYQPSTPSSEDPVGSRLQSSRSHNFNRKYGSLADLRNLGVATRMPSNEELSEDECVSECLQPAVKEFNSDFYRLCAVDSARSLLTSSRSLTTSESSSQTEAEYILQMDSVSTGVQSSSDSDDSEGCFCNRLVPRDNPYYDRLGSVQSSPTHRPKRSPKRKNLKIKKSPRRQDAGVYYVWEAESASQRTALRRMDGVSSTHVGNVRCALTDEEKEYDSDIAPCDFALLQQSRRMEESGAACLSPRPRLKVAVKRMRRLGSNYLWRRQLWRREKYPERGKEGCETAWVHLQADVDLSDPQARAVLLDTMMASSSSTSSSDDDVRLERKGLSNPPLVRRHKHKAFSDRCPRENATPQDPQFRASMQTCPTPRSLYDDGVTECFDIVDDISVGHLEDLDVLPKDCGQWDSPVTLEGEPIDHISLSDSCAESYTSSSENLDVVV